MEDATASVIIPAYNEAAVIERCLAGLLSEANPGEFDVVVVANGCSDATAERVRRFAPEVTVLDLVTASKAAALNAGDAAARTFPRIYLDADVSVTTDTIRAVVQALADGAFVAAPRIRVNLDGRPIVVCCWYKIWLQLPYITDSLVGSGFYGLSQHGRGRFGSFPETMADDFFVRSRFKSAERTVVKAGFMQVEAPFGVGGLLAARTRIAAVNRADRSLFTNAQRALRHRQRRGLAAILRRRRDIASLAVYVAVEATARAVACFGRFARRPVVWRHDESARRAAGASADSEVRRGG